MASTARNPSFEGAAVAVATDNLTAVRVVLPRPRRRGPGKPASVPTTLDPSRPGLSTRAARLFGRGYAGPNAVPAGQTTAGAAGEARRLPLPRQGRRRPLHRQGQVVAAACPVVLPAEPRQPDRDPPAAGPGCRRRGDRDAERGGGASPRAEPRQAPPAAVQCPPPGRQVVPVHRRHGR